MLNMTPEQLIRLERLEALIEENNKILREMRRVGRYQTYARIAYWVIIIALVYGAYAYTKPVLGGLLDQYTQVIDQIPGGRSNNMEVLDRARTFLSQ